MTEWINYACTLLGLASISQGYLSNLKIFNICFFILFCGCEEKNYNVYSISFGALFENMRNNASKREQ